MISDFGHWKLRSGTHYPGYSPALLIHENIITLRQEGRTVYQMAFGGYPFPLHPLMQESLFRQITRTESLSAVGHFELQIMARRYFISRLGMEDRDYRIIINNNEDLLLSLHIAVEGGIVCAVPSRGCRLFRSRMFDKSVLAIPLSRDTPDGGYRLEGPVLRDFLAKAIENGNNPTKLVLGCPNDPAAYSCTGKELEEIAKVCREYGILVISDETFGLSVPDGNHVSISRYYPEGTVVLSGLSHYHNLDGTGFGIALVPGNMENVYQAMRGVTDEVSQISYSPVHYGILTAFMGHPEIEEYITKCVHIHQVVCRYTRRKIQAAGLSCPVPEGVSFLYPDFGQFRKELEDKYAVTTSGELAESLLLDRQVASLPGTAFCDDPNNLCVRLSTLDFNGKAAIEYMEKFGLVSEENFIDACCPRIEEGTRRVIQYIGK